MARRRSAKEPGLRLKRGARSSTVAVTFPGFPGTYAPGEAVGLSELGLTEKEAKERIKESDLPLEFTSAEVEVENGDEGDEG